MIDTQVLRRFLTKISIGDGCWEWQATTQHGYGIFTERNDGKTHKAHRLTYELLEGPIPDGLTLDHLCRNRACVNPGHLEPVTHKVNILRGTSRQAENARKTHCKHGHPFAGANLSVLNDQFGKRRRCLACQREAGSRWRRKCSPAPKRDEKA